MARRAGIVDAECTSSYRLLVLTGRKQPELIYLAGRKWLEAFGQQKRFVLLGIEQDHCGSILHRLLTQHREGNIASWYVGRIPQRSDLSLKVGDFLPTL